MEPSKVPAVRRTGSGKEASRRLRRDGMIPAVVYGKQAPAESLAVAPKDLLGVLSSELGRNSVIELEVQGEAKRTVLLADYQYHPVSRHLLHADFLQIRLDQPVEVDVPLELTGRAKGVVLGGVLRQVFRKLPIVCLPTQIPVKIGHDVTELELDDHVAVRDLALPEGVRVRLPDAQTVAAVVTETHHAEEAEEKPAAEAEAAAAPAAAAPVEKTESKT